MRQLTFEYTCQLTAFYGAQRAYGTARLSKTNSLVIHVVGARQAETLDLTRWEIFCYQLPKLQNLIVVFIGPELVWVKTYFSIIFLIAVHLSGHRICYYCLYNNFFFEALNFQDSKWYSSKYFSYFKVSPKVHIFWEGHKILRNLHLSFVLCSGSQK